MDEFIKEFSELQAGAIEKAITIADKYEVDRHSALQMLADVLGMAVEIGDYSEYQTKAQREADNG